MKKLLFFILVFSLISVSAEAKPFSRSQGKGQYLPFAVKQSNKKHRTWKQKPVKKHNLKYQNCMKW